MRNLNAIVNFSMNKDRFLNVQEAASLYGSVISGQLTALISMAKDGKIAGNSHDWASQHRFNDDAILTLVNALDEMRMALGLPVAGVGLPLTDSRVPFGVDMHMVLAKLTTKIFAPDFSKTDALNLELTFSQATVLERALEFYAKVGCGALEKIPELIADAKVVNLSVEDYAHEVFHSLQNAFSLVKKNIGFDYEASNSIANEVVDFSVQLAWETKKELSKALALILDADTSCKGPVFQGNDIVRYTDVSLPSILCKKCNELPELKDMHVIPRYVQNTYIDFKFAPGCFDGKAMDDDPDEDICEKASSFYQLVFKEFLEKAQSHPHSTEIVSDVVTPVWEVVEPEYLFDNFKGLYSSTISVATYSGFTLDHFEILKSLLNAAISQASSSTGMRCSPVYAFAEYEVQAQASIELH